MRKYHPLEIVSVGRETPDSVRITLDVPSELADAFRFQAGQHLPVEATIDGKTVRRTYSICSAPGVLPLELGIRVHPHGLFSEYAAARLRAGDRLHVMPPFGRFHVSPAPAGGRHVAAFAGGSGITPILSILRAVLENEPESRATLFYGNRSQQTTMFIDELFALKNRFPDRLQLVFLFSREEQEFPILHGRLDSAKVRELHRHLLGGAAPDEAYVCGPGSMIEDVSAALVELGLPEDRIHSERFGVRRRAAAQSADVLRQAADEARAEVTVIMDGHRKTFSMPMAGTSVVDAAAAAGIELPYSCKGGVCATCRTHLRDGRVRMDTNYGLEDWEVEAGFVLACQSHPETARLVLDYDKT